VEGNDQGTATGTGYSDGQVADTEMVVEATGQGSKQDKEIQEMIKVARNDGYGKKWILENALSIIEQYESLTIRQLYYRLVSIGMPNSLNHYKRVVNAMTSARWDAVVEFDVFIDRERELSGTTEYYETSVENAIRQAERQITLWATSYSKNRWENQDYYVEVWIEKKALQGVFEPVCKENAVALAPCKGYPSLTFLNEAKWRFNEAIDNKKECVILYYGDYDPSGQDIPRSIEENLQKMGVCITIEHKMLHPDQIELLNLPGVPPKASDSRTANWDGSSAVELDAVDPHTLANMCDRHINRYFDEDKYEELLEQEEIEKEEFIERMKEIVATL